LGTGDEKILTACSIPAGTYSDRGVLSLNYPKMQSHSVIHGSQHQTYIMPDTGNIIIDWLINMRKNKSEILIYKFTLLI
jgi:hypothetical protein